MKLATLTLPYRTAIAFLALFTLAAAPLQTRGQMVSLPQASPAASASQIVGITEISVAYSRPSANGREIWGGLVPYGLSALDWSGAKQAPWRAGANENTVLSFQHDAQVEGSPIAAGSYGLHLIVERSGEVTVILSHNHTSWGSYFYDPAEDALRVTVRSEEAAYEEQLAYSFSEVTQNGAVLELRWADKRIPIRLQVDTESIVVESLKREMRGAHGFRYQNLVEAANYLLAHDLELELALEWAETAISRPWVGKRLPETLDLKARVLEKLGRRAEANAVRRSIADLNES